MDLQIVIQNSVCQIQPAMPRQVFLEIDSLLSFGVEGAKYSSQFQLNQWDGLRHLMGKTQKFPTGYLADVVAKLRELGETVTLIDQRAMPAMGDVIPIKLPLWEHQAKILKVCAATNRGLIQVATGGGKSLIAAGIWGMLNVPGVILAQRKELMRQLQASLAKHTGEKIGIFGDGEWEEGKLTVCMVQSLAKLLGVKLAKSVKEFSDRDDRSDTLIKARQAELYQKLIVDTRLLIGDECHHLAANTSYAIVQAMHGAYWRYGMSATSYGFREDGKDYFIKAAIGDVIAKVTTSDLVDAGHLVPTDIVEIPYSHRGKHHSRDSYAKYCDSAIITNEERNRVVVELAYGLFKKGKPVLISVQRVDHGKLLAEYLSYLAGPHNVKFVYGNDEGAYRKEHLEAFANTGLPILISTLVGEGIDWPRLAHCINCRGEESRIATIQLLGRSMRAFPGKERAMYFDIMDTQTTWLARHAKTRASVYAGERCFSRYAVKPEDVKSFIEEKVK